MNFKIKYVFVLIMLSAFGCTKDEESNAGPIIAISEPFENKYYSVGDDIQIIGSVKDDNGLSSISINLKNGNGINVINTINISPSVSEYSLNETMKIDNPTLTSGGYYLDIFAEDNQGSSSNRFVNINIGEIPRYRKGIFLFHNEGSETVITQIDSLNQVTILGQVAGDYLGGVVNSSNQEVMSCGDTSGNLQAFDLPDGSTSWSIENNFAGQANFTGIASFNEAVYISYFNREIRSYLNNGTPFFSALALENHYGKSMLEHNDELLIVEQKEITNSNGRLAAYYLASGAEKQNAVLNDEVVGMYSINNNEVALFVNENGNGKVKVFDINQNSIYNPFSINNGLITSTTEISDGVYMIAQAGDLYIVNVPTFSKQTYLTGMNIDKIAFDPTSNELVTIANDKVDILNYSSKQSVYSYTNTSPIKDVVIWYNK